ncbi:MAG: hypothetical protein ACHQWU_12320 [Gemmatimonadales bacterium]
MIEAPDDLTPAARADSRRHFRRTLMSVMGVQVVTLLLLWLFQTHFSP